MLEMNNLRVVEKVSYNHIQKRHQDLHEKIKSKDIYIP